MPEPTLRAPTHRSGTPNHTQDDERPQKRRNVLVLPAICTAILFGMVASVTVDTQAPHSTLADWLRQSSGFNLNLLTNDGLKRSTAKPRRLEDREGEDDKDNEDEGSEDNEDEGNEDNNSEDERDEEDRENQDDREEEKDGENQDDYYAVADDEIEDDDGEQAVLQTYPPGEWSRQGWNRASFIV